MAWSGASRRSSICASLVRQFEFAQNVWVNDQNFHELGNERDPIIGTQDGTFEFKIPKSPDSQDNYRPPVVHDRPGRRLLLPSRTQGAGMAGGNTKES